MKLIEGQKYTLRLPEWTYIGVYYAGKCDSLLGQACGACGKELQSGLLFMVPLSEQTTYKECINGSYTEQIALGISCKKKIKIE